MLGLLLKEGPDDLFDYCLLTLPLTAKRAIACTNAALHARIARLSSPVLYVRKEDATFENAQFVARLPGLTTVFVEGETTLPAGLEVARLRNVARINCSCLQFETGLFLGVALAAGEHRFRLSSGVLVNLAPLRTRDRLCLASNLTRTDLAVLLGALALNPALTELDLSGLLQLEDEDEEKGFAQLAAVFKTALPGFAAYATSGQISLRGRLHANVVMPMPQEVPPAPEGFRRRGLHRAQLLEARLAHGEPGAQLADGHAVIHLGHLHEAHVIDVDEHAQPPSWVVMDADGLPTGYGGHAEAGPAAAAAPAAADPGAAPWPPQPQVQQSVPASSR